MDAGKRTKTIKRALWLATLALILAATVAFVGASFSWFSGRSDAAVNCFDLSTQSAASIRFDNVSGGANVKYRGQTALDAQDRVISPYVSGEETYLADSPYYFVSVVQISTGGKSMDVSLRLDGVSISKDGVLLDSYGDATAVRVHDRANIPLAFTWFFKASTGGDVLSPSNRDLSGEDKLLPLVPRANEIWYTPYGVMRFSDAAQGEIPALISVNGSASVPAVLPAEQLPIEGFCAEDGSYFDLYVIFAPERMFWGQFFTGSRGGSVAEAYKDFDTDGAHTGQSVVESEIFPQSEGAAAHGGGMYYAEQEKYVGCTFKFGAVLEEVGADMSVEEGGRRV